MFRITRETDYGIVLLARLAGEPPGTVHAARDLALCGQPRVPMVSKILGALARAGLLVSHRGTKGGYSLARGPEEISVADVIQALEGPLGITECASMPGSCDQESVCPIRTKWQEISQTVVDFLARIRLTDLANSTPLPPMVLALGSRHAQGTCGSCRKAAPETARAQNRSEGKMDSPMDPVEQVTNQNYKWGSSAMARV